MKNRSSTRIFFKTPIVIHPLLLSIYPILFLFTHNIGEMSPNQMVLPMAVSIGFAIVLWVALGCILGNIRKAGMATTLFLFFFFAYGHLYELLTSWGVFVPKHAYLLPSALLICGYCIYFISLLKSNFHMITTILNVIALLLIIINLANITIYQITKPKLVPAQAANRVNPSLVGLESLPDIYYIVLDEYSHLDTMREYYNFDNSRFIKSLEEKGFFVAHRSKTRSPHTPQIIAQVLNMEFLTGGWNWDKKKKKYIEIKSGEHDFASEPSSDLTFRKLAYSKSLDFLMAKGYRYIAFGNSFTKDRYDRYMEDNADQYFNYFSTADGSWISEFQAALWNTSMLKPFYYHMVGGQYEIASRRQTLHTLEHIKKMVSVAGPKFVFAHIFCPHADYVFGSQGEYIAHQNWGNYKDKQYYRGQYIFITREIEKTVDVLLKKSKNPPVIILQSDHGQRPNHHPDLLIGIDEWRKILNALYLPGVDRTELNESISPVNTFRLIFNRYFGAAYRLLEDD